MRDLTSSWPEVPVWSDATLDRDGLTARTVILPSQHLVSGNLEAFAAKAGLSDTGVGLFQMVSGERYALRLARDRMLVVDGPTEALAPGWHADGYAVTDVSALYHIFEFDGDGIAALLEEAMAVDPKMHSPSAASMFAGQPAVVYHHEGRVRLHVERGHAPYLWQWLEARD
jgi:sarcosine oxidase gamma subunit